MVLGDFPKLGECFSQLLKHGEPTTNSEIASCPFGILKKCYTALAKSRSIEGENIKSSAGLSPVARLTD